MALNRVLKVNPLCAYLQTHFRHKTRAAALVLTCLITVSASAPAGLFDGPRGPLVRSMFRSVSSPETIFRAQSGDGVPLPPGASGGATIGTPPAGSFPMGTPAPQTYSLPPGSVPSDSVPFGSYPTDPNAFGIPTSPEPSTWNAFSPPISPDPFVQDPGLGNAPYAPYSPYSSGSVGSPYSGGLSQPFSTPGTTGPQPYRQGWQPRLDIEWMPESNAGPGSSGDFEQFGADFDMAYTGPFMPGWMFTWTNQFRLRNWDGPGAGPGLPGKAFHFGVDFELETPSAGPISMSLGITPSINTDFAGSLGQDAFQLDGRGMFIFKANQYWDIVLGAAYWDRVDDRVIPYAGLVYRDDFWEWRLMYPESMVSVFMGNGPGGSTWLYARAEYHVEAYEVQTTGGIDQAELEDYRAVLGIRTDNGSSSWFLEGGWVFERNVIYDSPLNTGFSPDSGFIARMGWRY